MVLPDALSRLSRADHNEVTGGKVPIHELVDVSMSRLDRLRKETDSDETLRQIKEYVHSGWPSSCKSLPAELRQ